MDMTDIGTAYEGLKIGRDILKSLSGQKNGKDNKEKIEGVLSKLGEAQDTLFAIREELIRLQNENVALNTKIATSETWDRRLSEYELAKTLGGAVVYKFKGEPEHYSCPSCVSKKIIEILQDNRTQTGKYRCVGCRAEFPIEPSRPSPTQRVTGREF